MSDGATTMVETLTGYAFKAMPIPKKVPMLGKISQEIWWCLYLEQIQS